MARLLGSELCIGGLARFQSGARIRILRFAVAAGDTANIHSGVIVGA